MKTYYNEQGRLIIDKEELKTNDLSYFEAKKPPSMEIKEGLLQYISPFELNHYSYIDIKLLNETLNCYESNNFARKLKGLFDNKLVEETLIKYKVGTSKTWKGATVFWHMDYQGRVCNGEVMNYNFLFEDPMALYNNSLTESMSSILYKKGLIDAGFNQKPTLFGEHLLPGNKKPVAIVQYEMTAIMASMQFPKYVWLATGFSDLTYGKVNMLLDDDVILCPNKDNFDNWYRKAIDYHFKISPVINDKFYNRHRYNASITDWILDQVHFEDHYEWSLQ